KVGASIAYFISALTSSAPGQMWPMYTGLPSLVLPRGSVLKSVRTEPASAYATTSGGEARKLARRFGWMRASKLRLPESTAAHTRSFFTTASSIGWGSGPALPMQVVQPYAATLKPSFSRYGSSPVLVRYSVTTRDPGARE